MTEDKMVGWHHRLNGHEFEQAVGVGDGQRGMVCCSPWGHKESDMTERLNCTEMREPEKEAGWGVNSGFASLYVKCVFQDESFTIVRNWLTPRGGVPPGSARPQDIKAPNRETRKCGFKISLHPHLYGLIFLLAVGVSPCFLECLVLFD